MKTFSLRCVVLEDEDDIRTWMVQKLQEYPELEIVGEATNIDDAYRLIATTKPDVAFMDVQLIGGDAFALLTRLQQNSLPIPYIVMTTGYPEYVMTALNEYRHYVVQYLTKPFVENYQTKFRKAIDALMAATANNLFGQETNLTTSEKTVEEKDYIFLQNKGSLLRLDFKNIAYLEAAGKGGSIVVLNDKTHTVDLTLAKFLNLLPNNFYKISRSNVVNTDRVLSINRGERTLMIIRKPKNMELGISDHYYNDLLGQLPLAKDKLNASSKKQGIVSIKGAKNAKVEKGQKVNIIYLSLRETLSDQEESSSDNLNEKTAPHFHHFEQFLNPYGFKKYRTTRDSFIAIATSEKKQDSNTEDLINAAIKLRQWTIDQNLEQKAASFEIRIGIHSGIVKKQCKDVKTESYEEFVATLKSVENSSQSGEINVSTNIWKEIRKVFDCRFMESIATKEGAEIEFYTIKI